MYVHSLPFGKHKGRPLPQVPSGYLQWLIRECKLSSGMRSAVADELRHRNIDAPAPAPPRPLRPCRDHPDAELLLLWMEDRLGRRRIRAECSMCRRPADYPPCVPPYSTQADANVSPTAALDALTALQELGVELRSDGRGVWVAGEDWRRVPADLHATIRQQSNLLARMIGNTTGRGA
jgi:hypothetical protein